MKFSFFFIFDSLLCIFLNPSRRTSKNVFSNILILLPKKSKNSIFGKNRFVLV